MKIVTPKSIAPILSLCAILSGAIQGYSQPTVNAPTPSRSPAAVLSMFNSSGTYTDHGGIGWYAGWSGVASMGDYTIAGGNTVKSYLGLSYSGVEFYNPNQIDASAYNTLHADVWTTANQIAIKLVSTDNGAAPEVYYPASGGVVTSNHWVSLDIPLSAFTDNNPNLDLANLDQLLWIDNGDISGPGVQLGDFYIDNVYFYSNSVVAPPVINYPTNNAPTPTQPPGSVLAMYNSSGTYTVAPIDSWRANWSGANYFPFTITNTPNVVLKYTGLNYDGVEFYNPHQLDVTPYNTMHVDLWTPNANQFGIQLVSLNPTTAPQVNFTPASGVITTNHWISLDIPLSAFTNANPAVVMSALEQLLWIDNQNGGGVTAGTFYIDNVYFYTSATIVAPQISASVSGGNMQLSFLTQSGPSYTVQYKTNLTDAAWNTLTVTNGTGTSAVVKDPATKSHRYYRLSIQ